MKATIRVVTRDNGLIPEVVPYPRNEIRTLPDMGREEVKHGQYAKRTD